MNPSKTKILLSALALGVVLVGCGRGEDTLAKVDGDAITVDELNEYLSTKPTVRVMVQGQVVALPVAPDESLAFQAMQDLVIRRAMLQMAADEGVTPTDQEVEKEIEFRTQLNPNYIKELQGRGFTMGQIRKEVMVALAEEKLVTKGITVTDAEVEQYIVDNPNNFITPARADLFWVVLTDAPDLATKKQAVDRELAAGTRFQEIATRYSEDPNARQSGGRYPANVLTQMAPAVRSAVEAASPGDYTPWIEAQGQHARFFVNQKLPEEKIEMTAARKEALRRQIAMERGRRAIDLRERIVERLKVANISVERSTLKDAWKRFEDRLKDVADDQGLPTDGGPEDQQAEQ